MVLIKMYGKVIIHKKFKKIINCFKYVNNICYICNINYTYMLTHFKHLFQTILYYLVESSITAIFVFIIWKIFLKKYFTTEIEFTDFIFGIFVIKIILSNIYATVLELDKQHENKN